MNAPVWLWLALPGLLAGVGVRGAVWRWAVEEPPRTRCAHCGAQARGLLPPLRLFTGRCRRCKEASLPPPFVPELLTAAGFAVAGWIGGGPWRVAALCWLVAFGLAAVLVDVAVRRLPDAVTWPCLAGVVLLSCAQATAAGTAAPGVRAVLAGAAAGAVFLVLALTVGVGLGDVKWAGSIGAALGYVSWSAVVAGIAAGFCLAGLQVAVSLTLRRASLSGQVALGPPLLVGAFLVLVLTAA